MMDCWLSDHESPVVTEINLDAVNKRTNRFFENISVKGPAGPDRRFISKNQAGGTRGGGAAQGLKKADMPGIVPHLPERRKDKKGLHAIAPRAGALPMPPAVFR